MSDSKAAAHSRPLLPGGAEREEVGEAKEAASTTGTGLLRNPRKEQPQSPEEKEEGGLWVALRVEAGGPGT